MLVAASDILHPASDILHPNILHPTFVPFACRAALVIRPRGKA
jgi:hypothetical protein